MKNKTSKKINTIQQMSTNELITYGPQYSYSKNYAAICCGYVHWRVRLIRSQIVAGNLVTKSAKCPFCEKQLVFGEWKGEESNLECGKKQLGKVLALFNIPCKVLKAKQYCLTEVGKVWLVRIFQMEYNNDAYFYIVPHDKPDATYCIVLFNCRKFFNEYMKLISQTEFDSYFTAQRFDL